MGKAIEAGHDSHYVVCNGKGEVPPTMAVPEQQLFDELVLSSETSVAPLYLISINVEAATRFSSNLMTGAALELSESEKREFGMNEKKKKSKGKAPKDDSFIIELASETV